MGFNQIEKRGRFKKTLMALHTPAVLAKGYRENLICASSKF